ncbi:transporter [Bacillus lacus]|uniref:Transporter n=1 Tax=Metabacillus lacus TaxID=1983721 RepID=A0A7X2IWT2_9BACI|nr:cadmium resistance transporter [Metabacillus lacus]MRX71220.1 transporter [Metabacillus lacus]
MYKCPFLINIKIREGVAPDMDVLLTAIIAFVSTNIDDIFVLMALFSQLDKKSLSLKQIVAGQYAGIVFLTLVSALAAWGLFFVPVPWIGLLGLVPLYIGIKGLLQLRKHASESEPEEIGVLVAGEDPALFKGASSTVIASFPVIKVAAITIGNGGDNIAIYIPLFANSGLSGGLIITAVFMLLVGVWCYLGFQLVKNPIIAKGIKAGGNKLIPFVFIVLGLYIIMESETYSLFL